VKRKQKPPTASPANQKQGELCIVIGKDFKDIKPEEDPFDYVLGYTAGNDVSSRYWQAPGRSSQQAGYAKSFDKFAPIGPYICSTTAVPDPGALTLTTKVNGEVRQQGRTDDLVFDVPAILRFLGRGRTIRRGTVIMTGTPGGVAAFMKPPAWLIEGDVVEVEIEKIGLIRNRFVATP
jgi:2-keto-4-pentenoate hydratase/2-oxohepta-3-ene-1,7-dioic acid hydratase in catechol pathway